MNCIVYSKDRPAQLDLLLRSIRRFAPHLTPSIIMQATNSIAANGYSEVLKDNAELDEWYFKWELKGSNFKDITFSQIDNMEEHTMFLMDDDVFINPWDGEILHKACITSLRLHPGVTECYASGKKCNPPGNPVYGWNWTEGEGDWGYPMSLDGHIFQTTALLQAMQTRPWHNPNTLEAALACHPLDFPVGRCYKEAKIINIPHNRVQNTYNNRSEGGDVDALNRAFLEGNRLAIPGPGPYPSVHVPLEYTYE